MDQTTEDIETWLQGLKEEAAPFIHADLPKEEAVYQEPEVEEAPSFVPSRKSSLDTYLQASLMTGTFPDPSLLILSGYAQDPKDSQERLIYSLLPNHYQKSSGGFYVKAFGKGFAINPGTHFLEKLHQKGVTVQDIDFVIVTSGNPEDFAEAVSLYDLNYKCNMHDGKLHIIHYYLHKQAYKSLLGILKPRFKQERDTVNPLELYEDSPNIESISLTEHVNLSFTQSPSSALSIALEIESLYSIGWLAEDDATLLEKEGHFDVLFLANPAQQSLVQHLHDKPLILCFGQESSEQDLRLETVRKLRQTLKTHAVLPCDRDLLLHLEDLSIECVVCKQPTPSEKVHVVKSTKAFGKLLYLCPSCCL